MKNKKCEESVVYYILLFLSCLNLFKLGSSIFLIFTMIVIYKSKFKLCKNVILYVPTFILFVSICFTGFYYFGIQEAVKSLNYMLPVFAGATGYAHANRKEKFIINSVGIIFLGYACQVTLIYFYNLMVGQPSVRELYGIWFGEKIAVTLVALLCSVIVGYSFYVLFCCKMSVYKIIVLFFLCITLLINMMTATRTVFLMFGLVYSIMWFLYTIKEKGKKTIKLWCMLFVIVCVVLCLYEVNFYGIKDIISNSYLIERFVSHDNSNGRIKLIFEHLKYANMYMVGGNHISKTVGLPAHNIIQEVYDRFGCIASFNIIIILVISVTNMCKIVLKKNMNKIDYMMISTELAIFVQLFIEPVTDAFPILFWTFLYIQGIMCIYINKSKN